MEGVGPDIWGVVFWLLRPPFFLNVRLRTSFIVNKLGETKMRLFGMGELLRCQVVKALRAADAGYTSAEVLTSAKTDKASKKYHEQATPTLRTRTSSTPSDSRTTVISVVSGSRRDNNGTAHSDQPAS